MAVPHWMERPAPTSKPAAKVCLSGAGRAAEGHVSLAFVDGGSDAGQGVVVRQDRRATTADGLLTGAAGGPQPVPGAFAGP